MRVRNVLSFVSKIKFFLLSAVVIEAVPFVALAQEFSIFITRVKAGLNIIIVFLFLVATVILLYGIVRYITAGGDEDQLKEGRAMILYGIIGLAIMVVVWAFVFVLIDFFFSSGTSINIPGRTEVPQQF